MSFWNFKLGLHPPVPGAVKLRLATYLNWSELPKPPAQFGHYNLVPQDNWGVLGNTTVGDCAIAGPCHQIMEWTASVKQPAPFDDSAALANYSAITGYDPTQTDPITGENPTDQGTDIDSMAAYWREHGLVDSNGKLHKIVAYVDMNPGDLRELWLATWMFQNVGMGFALPQSALDAAQTGAIWDIDGDNTIVGGHYVPAFGRKGGLGIGVSWGQVIRFTPEFYEAFNNQGVVAFSEDMMAKAKSIDGFDDKLLRADIRKLSSV